ncbi:hypothetical protein EMPS_00735 [Entomortierella parvispora]|uniref:F-box domain-containing protein n=1 Tax=Entomortierella parvispora TaxID=205924 RepID=A0A9P3H1N2_9FUNG|nr:hypothetical protein EMPS_00735 [Entomortierella parvispora]
MQMQPDQPRITSKNALAIPEILFSVGRFLPRHAVAQCLQVCQLWHFTLKPHLWTEIEVIMDAVASPPPEDALTNASFTRKLVFWYRLASHPLMAVTYPHLTDLTIVGPDVDRTKEMYDSLYADIIQRYRATLRNVTITIQTGGRVFEILSDCPRLETLAFSSRLEVSCVSQWIQPYQKLRSQLRTFVLHGPYIFKQTSEVLTLKMAEEWRQAFSGPNRIQDLTLAPAIHGHRERLKGLQVWIVEDCPDLVRLKWHSRCYGRERPTLMRALVNILLAGRHSRLEDVSLPFNPFDNQDFEDLLKCIRRLTRLDLSRTTFGPGSWEKLQAKPCHLETLVDLNLKGCYDLPGFTVVTMLCCLPSLKVFKATNLYESHLEGESRPWVCVDLEVLALPFRVPSGDLSTKSVQDFLRQISQLKKLKTWKTVTPRMGETLFPWKLSCGLDQLKSLRRLQCLDDTLLNYGQEELRWALENWPNLVDPPRQALTKQLQALSEEKKL